MLSRHVQKMLLKTEGEEMRLTVCYSESNIQVHFILFFLYWARFVVVVVLVVVCLDLICSSSGRTCLFGAFICEVATVSLMNFSPRRLCLTHFLSFFFF